MEITATIQYDDLSELDRVCRSRGVSRDEAVEDAVRWYIDREGDLPFADELQEDIEL